MPKSSGTDGQILRLRLKNFMTYTNLDFRPTSGLNLIIGPNGSGKSSIMSAVCLVLAGKASYTGRQIKLQEYIKYNCDKAVIEIQLRDSEAVRNNGVMTITRTISSNGTSVYMLNKSKVKESEVEEQVKRFNVQVNNLCQFLPQEKVSEFAKMNSRQLLESMQQAVGDKDMFDNYELLIELRSKTRELEKDINEKKTFIEGEKKENEALAPRVDVFQKREEYQRKLDLLKKKKPLAEYLNEFSKLGEAKKRRKDIEIKLDNHRSMTEPLEAEREIVEGTIADLESKIDNKGKLLDRFAMDEKHVMKDIKENEDQIYNEKSMLRGKLDRQRERENDILVCQQQIQSYGSQLAQDQEKSKALKVKVDADAEVYRYYSEQAGELGSSITQYRKAVTDLTQQRMSLESKLQDLSSIERKKMDFLKQRHSDSYQAVLWLNENKHQFKKHVYTPLLMLIDVPITADIIFVENHIQWRDMLMFLCEDKDDTKKLTNILHDKQKLAINIACVPDKPMSAFVPRIRPNDLKKQYGFDRYLMDLFKAPDAVVKYLCENYNIHNTPVTNSSAEQIMRNAESLPFSRFYTADTLVTVKRSRYGNRHVSCLTSQIRERGILSTYSDTSQEQKTFEARLKETEETMEDHMAKQQYLEEQLNETSRKLDVFRKQKQEYHNLMDNIRTGQQQVKQKEKKMASLRSNMIDVHAEKLKSEIVINNIKQLKVEALERLDELISKYNLVVCEKVFLRFRHTCFWRKKTLTEKRLREATSEYGKLESEYEAAAVACRTRRESCKTFLKNAQEVLGFVLNSPEGKARVREMFGTDLGTLEEVESEINKLSSYLSLNNADDTIIKQHTQRKKDIIKEERSLANLEREFNRLQAEIEAKKAQWLEPLEDLIREISSTFSKHFKTLGCSGEVALDKSNNPEDFDRYGLSILVKYRDAVPLRELSQLHHSGGECSVATITFILSLQELTEVPFRCVDEINQGMDSTNEGCIFKLVSESSEKSTQYFLLTPKLLPGLEYSPSVRIHIIQNGSSLDIRHWNIRKMVRSVQDVSDEEEDQ